METVEIHTDQEEEFRLLERLGKTQIKSYYSLIVMFLFLSWFIIVPLMTRMFEMKNGLNQIITPMLLMQLVVNIIQLISTKKFLKINKKSIEKGKEIEFIEAKFYVTRISLAVTFLTLFVMILYVLYSSIFLRNKVMLLAFIPSMIGLTGGLLFRAFVKPTKHSKKYKIIAFVVTIVAISAVGSLFSILGIMNIEKLVDENNIPSRDKYRVLLRDDFVNISTEIEEGTLRQNTSILIPRSYEYTSIGPREDDIRYIETHYSKALTTDVAKELVSRYKYEAVKYIKKKYSPELAYHYQSGELEEYLTYVGLTKNDVNRVMDKELKQATQKFIEIIKGKRTEKIDSQLWGVDEACFLADDKQEIVLRKGREVFYLKGLSFEDPKVIKRAKGILQL